MGGNNGGTSPADFLGDAEIEARNIALVKSLPPGYVIMLLVTAPVKANEAQLGSLSVGTPLHLTKPAITTVESAVESWAEHSRKQLDAVRIITP